MDKVFNMLRVASRGIIFEKKGVNVIVPYLKELLKLEGTTLFEITISASYVV